MRTIVATPMSRGIVWPAEHSELTPWILFHLIVSSVAATIVLATATLQADRSCSRLSTCILLLDRSDIHRMGVPRGQTETLYLCLGACFSTTNSALLRTVIESTMAQEDRSRKDNTILSTSKPFSFNVIFAKQNSYSSQTCPSKFSTRANRNHNWNDAMATSNKRFNTL